MSVDAVRNGYFQARFDHKNNTVHFGGQVRLVLHLIELAVFAAVEIADACSCRCRSPACLRRNADMAACCRAPAL